MPRGTRTDGRGDEEPRPLVVALDVVTAAAGSAYVELGSTKVSCAVYGPRQNELAETTSVERGTLNVDVRFAAHVDGRGGGRRKKSRGNDEGAEKKGESRKRALEALWDKTTTTSTRERDRRMKNPIEGVVGGIVRDSIEPSVIVETFPKTQVDVYLTVMDSDGSGAHVSACVMAASAALARAGIECRDLVTACHAVRIDGRVVVDPTSEEEEASDGCVRESRMCNGDWRTRSNATGTWNPDDMDKAYDICAQGCHAWHEAVREALRAADEEEEEE